MSAASTRYGCTGWEAETDLGNDDDREGVYFLTITEDEEEAAVVIHRTCGGEFPLDGDVATQKYNRALHIRDALNEEVARRGSTPVWVDPEDIDRMAGCIAVVLSWAQDHPGEALSEDMLANIREAREVAGLLSADLETYQRTQRSPLEEE